MPEEHGELYVSSFNLGAEKDTEVELAYSKSGTGLFYDMRNGRPISADGNTGAAEKISGEVLLYPNTTAFTGYFCCASTGVNNNIVEIWMPTSGIGPGVIRINGVVVLQSSSFILSLNQVQIDKNEALTAEEIYVTDNTIPPSIFSIIDLLNSVSTPKYFTAFDPLLYQINLEIPLDRPVFVGLKDVGVGLPVGQYQYEIQYANDEGDVTNWSMATDLIAVVEGLSQQSSIYPWCKTYGGPPAPSSPTSYAIHLKFRVTNIYNYQYINIKRIPYNEGAGVNFTPNGVIVAKIAITPGEISVRDYYDPNESNTNVSLSEVQETQVIAEIQSAKSIRYFNRRLVLGNVQVRSKITNPSFLTIAGLQGFPVIENMGTSGHKDPYYHATRRSFMRGEVEGFGMVEFDGVGGSGFVTKIPQLENYQFPNRRDTITTQTSDYSLFGTSKAATTNITEVGQTHEVFDLATGGSGVGQAKGDYYNFKNIQRNGSLLGLSGTKSKSDATHTDPATQSDSQIESYGAHIDTINQVSVAYKPYTPVRQSDQDCTGHNFPINTGVYPDDSNISSPGYFPRGFAPNYYSLGICIPGFSNFAPWTRAFAVVKTPPKNKVVCQGIGFYSLSPAQFHAIGNSSLTTKNQDRMWFYSPDIQNGIVSSDTVNDIIANSQNYTLQFVSPLGYFSEVYNTESTFADLADSRTGTIDMITYVRMLRDWQGGAQGGDAGLNPGESNNMGVNSTGGIGTGGDGFNYVTWEKYRNQSFPSPPLAFRANGNGGNQEFGISDVERIVEGRGEYLSIGSVGDFYNVTDTGGSSDNAFSDTGMQNWAEPLYIVNIIRNGTTVVDQNIQGYQQTTHYQKLKSIIGVSNGQANQKFILVDERWEDCIPAPNSTLFGASNNSYIYVKDPNTLLVGKWINVTYMTPAQIAVIVTGMPGNGLSGIYTHENINNQNRFYNIVFNQPGFIPANGSYIYVYYDNSAPIRVFGGDTYIGEAIFSPIDRIANSESAQADTTFAFGIGMPYHSWQMNSRYYQIKGSSGNIIQNATDELELGFIRQMVCMFTCEYRGAGHYAYNNQYPEQFFPSINYIIRPDKWDESKPLSGPSSNGIWAQYGIDYPGENDNWEWGGFRFLPQINSDYSCLSPVKFFSYPELGFTEQTIFNTGLMFSLSRVEGVLNSPSLKTFPANNLFIIDDNQGEIKYLWDATTNRGENLYAFTNKGICFLVTNKNILSDQNASQLAYMSGQFIQQQIWISKEIGMYDENWRGAAEGHVPIGQSEDGSEIISQALFFPNAESVYRFNNDTAVDVGRIGYYSKIFGEGISNVQSSFTTKMTAIYNRFFKEYWLYIKDPLGTDILFVFGQKNSRWFGTNDYKFDRFTTIRNNTYAQRNLETWKTNEGFIINGSPIVFEATTAASPEQSLDKEFMRVTINTVDNVKPTSVLFYYDENASICSLDQATYGSFYLKNYRGWSNQIPRADSSFDVKRSRVQGRSILWKVVHNLASSFKLIDSSILWKRIKGQS